MINFVQMCVHCYICATYVRVCAVMCRSIYTALQEKLIVDLARGTAIVSVRHGGLTPPL
jgi:hypothetical protein